MSSLYYTRLKRTFVCGCKRHSLGDWQYCRKHASGYELRRLIIEGGSNQISRCSAIALGNLHQEIFKYHDAQLRIRLKSR